MSFVSKVKCTDLGEEKEKITIEDFFSEVIFRLLQEKPKNPFSKIEQFCNLVKEGSFVPAKERSAFERLTKLYKPWMGVDDENILEKDFKRSEQYLALINPPIKPKKKTDEDVDNTEEGEEGLDTLKMSDILYEGKLFRDVGIGIGEMELIRLLVSMKSVVSSNNDIDSIRFFGKILGIEKNYYILETEQTKKTDEPEQDNDENEKKENGIPPETDGTNKYIYYVSNNVGGNADTWTRLPDSNPESINRSRKIKKFFTGRLDQQVLSHPPFKGTEMELLRCQIARISHSCILAPLGRMKLSADEDEVDPELNLPPNLTIANETLAAIEQNTEFEEQLAKLDISKHNSWVNLLPPILRKQGRCSFFWTSEEKENPDFDQLKKTVERIPKPLSSISKENWTIRSSHQSLDNEVICLSNRLWNGAFTVGYKRNSKDMVFSNVYIGYGYKGGAFSPQFLLPILNEYEEVKLCQQLDPTIEDMKKFIPPKKDEPQDNDEE
ncbi:predicted protein [Naegleria gruberi]|uniref:Predicted protein n=1 Tax=Naegleria gruberi TaxID=5762 RepID=D2UXI8_NAEGR|nr:uncharacterized protein NAEGRDRAFT_44954 [Naegleria gruberi]EFC50640.1 predicted protein [Naegleria gruberi]|eukprot:XP_002683384.1 predicted protein [Naegleria gruberi strain NEG-M]